MEISEIGADEVAILCGYAESHFYDRKSHRIAPKSLTKPLSAFANADGGELLLGIEDDGTWNGLPSVEAFNGHIQSLNSFFPFGADFDYQFLKSVVDESFIVRITVQKTREIKMAVDGVAYVRRGAQSLPTDSLDDLKRQKGLTTHETERINYPAEEISNSVTVIGFMLNVVPETEPDRWLIKQHLVESGMPTVAGTLLFHDEPQVHLPKASVKLYRYTTTDEEGTREQLAYDPISIDGPLYDVIADAVAQTVRQVEEIPVLHSTLGLTSVSYPAETLHEIITNAILHRDYAINDDVHVRIFDNRIEVQSPGSLPANVTPQNILDVRFARNPMIVRMIYKFPEPPNKDVGEGLNTAFRAMRKLELRDPEIVARRDSVIVIIRHESLADAESRIVSYLDGHDSINNREARQLLNRPEADRSIRRLFEKLVSSKEIERVPGTIKGGSRYRRIPR